MVVGMSFSWTGLYFSNPWVVADEKSQDAQILFGLMQHHQQVIDHLASH